MEKKNELIKTGQGQVTNLEERQRKDLALYSPTNCYKYSSKIKGFKDVLNLPCKTLGDFKRSYGREWVIGYVSMWLIELNDTANAKAKMNDSQIEATAERIFDSYSLKITDLTLFFRNIKEGFYGQYYENLDRSKIMEWLSIYFDQRCEFAEMLFDSEMEKINVNTTKVNPDVIKKMFEGVGETEIDHSKNGNGIGSRKKNIINADLIQSVKSKSTEELRRYLIDNDVKNPNYDEFITSIVESEIDSRK